MFNLNLETTMPLHPTSKTLRPPPPSRPISRQPSSLTSTTTPTTTVNTTTTTTTSPRKPPSSTPHRQRSSTLQQPDLITTAISPLIQTIHHLQSLAFHLLLNTLFALSLLLPAAQAIAYRSFLLSRIILESGVLAARWVYAKVWNGQRSRRFRKRLEFEIFVLLFGSGNTILLLVLWPGWIVLGMAAVGWWLVG
ncbi:hypothetical protein QBC40DRAFT_65456 [Triangularia verruculosa]|uniref:Uncharacterized protein n=1 Tax=Triangularia verruculosa TaxID=2587418 RepID=A0AAN6XT50_9PEZI|nr:hypothetical protein QBC40DRAFT_65456 [Triangularia verruculosa]